jgi:DNA (cytosine-5)-methyltransferase 1
MIYGSVCSGIEAATVAWHPLGWRPAWFSEIEDFPSRVLAHHYPHARNHGDFTTIRDSEPIDLLVGGTPCQSFSVAGLRGGLEDERGNLALEYCRLAQRLRPRWVVWENVPGVLSSNGGRDFGAILGALAELGYGVAYRVLDAQFVGGCEVHGEPFLWGPVPQRRRRVFAVGYLGDWRRAAAVLFEPESLRRDPPESRKKGKAAARSSRRRTESGGVAGTLNANGKAAGSATQQDAETNLLIPTVAGTLGGGSGNRGWACDTDRMTFIPQTVGALTARFTRRVHGASGINSQYVNAGHVLAFHLTQDPISGPVSPALAAGNRQGCASIGVAYGRNNTSGPISTSHALSAHEAHHGRLDFETETFIVQAAVRRLTPRECERLQGFPDDYTAIPGAADGPRYRALGNSMAVPVMRWIGRRIERVENIMRRFNVPR